MQTSKSLEKLQHFEEEFFSLNIDFLKC